MSETYPRPYLEVPYGRVEFSEPACRKEGNLTEIEKFVVAKVCSSSQF